MLSSSQPNSQTICFWKSDICNYPKYDRQPLWNVQQSLVQFILADSNDFVNDGDAHFSRNAYSVTGSYHIFA